VRNAYIIGERSGLVNVHSSGFLRAEIAAQYNIRPAEDLFFQALLIE